MAAARPVPRLTLTVAEDPRLAKANALQADGRDAEAVTLFQRILDDTPSHPVALNNLGVAMFRLGRPDEAERHWRAAIAAQPGYGDALANLASILCRRGEITDARALLDRAGPGHAHGWNNLGAAYGAAADFDQAIACYNNALRADPTLPEIYNNLGVSLQAANRRVEAIAAYRQAIALRPAYAEAWANLGTAFGAHSPEEAIAAARTATRAAPAFADAHHNLGLALLATGNYTEGWEEYAWWDLTPQAANQLRRFEVPLWDGGPLNGTLLLHCQQGFGDAIQFARYARNLPVPVILEAPRPLAKLFAPIVPIITRGEPLPPHAAHCPLHLLPHVRGLLKPTALPYLQADPAPFRPRLNALRGRRIGLCWAGNPSLGKRAGIPVNARRSIPLTEFDLLADIPDLTFVSLQLGTEPDPTARLKLHDWTAELTDFASTASLIAGLDLVITVDTAVAHLAGALGKPVWLLNRFDSDWRWGLGRDDCDWYLALRQFRQDRPGDWSDVLQRVRDALSPPDVVAIIRDADATWQRGDHLAATRLFRRAVALRPDFADGQSNLGLGLFNEGNLPAAETALRAALLTDPTHVPALVNLARVRRQREDLAEAEALYRRAIAADPDQRVPRANLANLLAAAGRGPEALPLYDAIDDTGSRINAAITLTQLQRPQESIPRLRTVLLSEPANPLAHLALGEALLLDGQYREGLREYAWRRHAIPMPGRTTTIPEWTGQAAPGKTLLVQSEQGMGDTIQFARFLADIAPRIRILAQVPAPLIRLIRTVKGVTAVGPREGPAPEADFRADLMDLARLLGARKSTLPVRPYLSADQAASATWQSHLATLPGRRIGLCWAGSPTLRHHTGGNLDARRSIPAPLLAPLGQLKGISWVSLQAHPTAAPPFPIADWTAELRDFADTAALMMSLDLVISVDTAVIHLAGSLGRPAYLLNRFDTDWRWGLDRETSAWYPSIRQFRQPSWGDWESVIGSVVAALRE